MTPEIAALEAKVPQDIRQKLQHSAREYEGVFMTQMMNIMFQNIDLDPLSEGSSAASDTYKGMLVTEYGKAMSMQGSGIGLADPIYKSLLETQLRSQEAQK
jgi:Rod binding domain-containing protein